MYNLGSTLSAGHLPRECKSMSDVCLCLLGSTNTQTLSYSHSSSWAGVTPCDTLCDYRFLLGLLLAKRTTIGRAWVSFWIMSHRSLKKMNFLRGGEWRWA